jgi:hypothetical protein
MFKRIVLLLLACVGLSSLFPAAAQSESVLKTVVDFVPADFAGMVRLNEIDPVVTTRDMNVAIAVAGLFQPARIAQRQNGYLHYDLIPFANLFDVADTSFGTTIQPWLNGEIVLAYKTFDGGLRADYKDFLIILATENPLSAANALKSVVRGQDLPEREMYRDVAIYVGDKAAIAFTTTAVFVGPVDLIKAALDVQAGEGQRLTDQRAYQAIQQSMPEDAFLTGYVSGDHLLTAVNGLLNGEAESTALLEAFGSALSQIRSAPSFAQMLLDGGFDGAGASVRLDEDNNRLLATALLHSAHEITASDGPFDQSLLDMMPRNALLVHSGPDFSAFLTDVMTAMPMSNFSGNLLGGFGLPIISPRNTVLTPPKAVDLTTAVNNFTMALKTFGELDLHADLLDHLGGNYALALLPRPNSPVPFLNTPFDLLIVTRAEDGEAAQTGVTKLLQALYGLDAVDLNSNSEWHFKALVDGRDAVFTVGYLEHMLIIATGDGEAASAALAAQQGDNRLTNQDVWKVFNEHPRHDFYVDPLVLINTFFPNAGGIEGNPANRIRAVVDSQPINDDLFQINVTVTLGQ